MQEFFKLTADNEIPVSAVNSKYSQPAMIAEPSGYGILRESVFSVLDNLQILTFYLQVFNNLFFPGL